MTPLKAATADYLLWLRVHNYAETSIACRQRYLDYFTHFCDQHQTHDAGQVTFELLRGYQQQLFEHRKRNGLPLTFATQAQRLVPVCHFFSWLRRSGRLHVNPAGDLLMPRPDRRLPEATLSAPEMTLLLAQPNVSRPLGLRDRAILEVFYSCALRRQELINLAIRDIDFDRGTVFVRNGKGAKDRYVPIGERALFWLRLYLNLARPHLTGNPDNPTLFVSSNGTPVCPDWLSRKIRRYLATAGINKNGSCHLLRHSSPPSCSKAAPTSATSPKCSATSASKQHSATPASASTASATSTRKPTPPPDSTSPWQPNSPPSSQADPPRNERVE